MVRNNQCESFKMMVYFVNKLKSDETSQWCIISYEPDKYEVSTEEIPALVVIEHMVKYNLHNLCGFALDIEHHMSDNDDPFTAYILSDTRRCEK